MRSSYLNDFIGSHLKHYLDFDVFYVFLNQADVVDW